MTIGWLRANSFMRIWLSLSLLENDSEIFLSDERSWKTQGELGQFRVGPPRCGDSTLQPRTCLQHNSTRLQASPEGERRPDVTSGRDHFCRAREKLYR